MNTFFCFKKNKLLTPLKSMALEYSSFPKIFRCVGLCIGTWDFSKINFVVTLKNLYYENSVAQNFIKVTIS